MIGKISLSGSMPTAYGLQESDLVKVVLIQESVKDADHTMYLIGKLNIINQVFWVRDGNEALNLLECNGIFRKSRFKVYPKLIICDLAMAEAKKSVFLENIKDTASDNKMSLVFLLPSTRDKQLLQKAGLSNCKYLFKPITLAMLKQVVLKSDSYFILPTYWENPEIDIMYRMTR